MSVLGGRDGFVVVAVHRPKPKLLERQLRSIAEQTLTNWTCLVGVDGADHAATALVHEIIGADPRFSVVEYPDNVGVYRQFERLLAETPADVAWVALSDQDDYFYPEKFAVLTAEMDEQQATAVVGLAHVVNESGLRLTTTARRQGTFHDAVLMNQMTGGSTIIRGDVVNAALPFPPDSRWSIHDHWLGVVAAALGSVVVSNKVVQDYVQHDENLIGEDLGSERRRKLARVRHLGIAEWVRQELTDIWHWRAAMSHQLVDNLGGRLPATPVGHRSVPRHRKVIALAESTKRGYLTPFQALALAIAGATHAFRRRL